MVKYPWEVASWEKSYGKVPESKLFSIMPFFHQIIDFSEKLNSYNKTSVFFSSWTSQNKILRGKEEWFYLFSKIKAKDRFKLYVIKM